MKTPEYWAKRLKKLNERKFSAEQTLQQKLKDQEYKFSHPVILGMDGNGQRTIPTIRTENQRLTLLEIYNENSKKSALHENPPKFFEESGSRPASHYLHYPQETCQVGCVPGRSEDVARLLCSYSDPTPRRDYSSYVR
jgi:hypothetical protein